MRIPKILVIASYLVFAVLCMTSVCLEPQKEKLHSIAQIDKHEAITNINAGLMQVYRQLRNMSMQVQTFVISDIKFKKGQDNNLKEAFNLPFKDYLLKHNFFNDPVLKYIIYFILGIISAFTPSILAVLPITIGWLQIITKQSAMRFVGLILFYVLLSSVIFGMQGLFDNLTDGVLGNFYVVLVISAFFILLAYWVMGAFELHSLNSNIFTTLLFGGLTGIILSGYIGPILLFIHPNASQGSSKLLSFFSLFMYAIGLNIPLMIGSIFVSTIKKILRWANFATLIKIFFGILILISVLYFTWGSFIKIYAYLVVITLILGLLIKKYMLNVFKSVPELTTQMVSKTNTATFIIFLSLTVGFFGKITIFDSSDKLFDKATIEEGIVRAKEQNKPLLVKFWAQWCPSCWEQKYTLFNDQDVIKKLKKFYLVEVDCTTDEKKYCGSKLQQFGVSGLPFMVFYNREGEFKYLIEGYVDKYKFIEVLNNLEDR